MPRSRFVLAAALLVTYAAAARAGVYCSLDQLPYPVPTEFSAVKSKLTDLQGVRNEDKEQQQTRERYETYKKALEAKERDGSLTADERLDLSGVYLRLGRAERDAIRVLEGERTHFLALTHLAVAYDNLGVLERAISYQQQALDAWPNVSLRWSAPQLAWYRRAERYYLELLRLRQQEARTGAGRGWDRVDALFPRLRLETPDGGYELGGPAKPTERLTEDVPQDALALVAQLVWWLPFDHRVFWLYGELLNYHGNVEGADKALQEFGFVRPVGRIPLLTRHQRALSAGKQLWAARRELLWVARPPGVGAPPGVGELPLSAAQVVATAAAMRAEADPVSFSPGLETAATVPPARTAAASWLPDWRTAAVCFGAGMVVMALVQLQWREWARRRAAPAPTRLTEPRPSGSGGGATAP